MWDLREREDTKKTLRCSVWAKERIELSQEGQVGEGEGETQGTCWHVQFEKRYCLFGWIYEFGDEDRNPWNWKIHRNEYLAVIYLKMDLNHETGWEHRAERETVHELGHGPPHHLEIRDLEEAVKEREEVVGSEVRQNQESIESLSISEGSTQEGV